MGSWYNQFIDSSLLTEQNSHTFTSVEALESLCTQHIYNQIILKKIQQQLKKSFKVILCTVQLYA